MLYSSSIPWAQIQLGLSFFPWIKKKQTRSYVLFVFLLVIIQVI
jgi:hypothetical protein